MIRVDCEVVAGCCASVTLALRPFPNGQSFFLLLLVLKCGERDFVGQLLLLERFGGGHGALWGCYLCGSPCKAVLAATTPELVTLSSDPTPTLPAFVKLPFLL